MNPEINGPNENQIEKVEPKKNAIVSSFTKLSLREKIMIYVLVIVAVISVLGFFVLIPAMDKITAIDEEIVALKEQDSTFRSQIAQTPRFEELYNEAKTNLATYSTLFYDKMDPESIDKMITTLIKNTGMQPLSLKISEIEAGNVEPFAPQSLRVQPVPILTSAGASTGSAVEEGATDSGAAANGEEDPAVAPTEEEVLAQGGYIFSYSVDVTAEADNSKLFKLIDEVKDMTSLELLSYSLIPPREEITNPTDILTGTPTQAAKNGTVTLKFKIYVFIPDADPEAEMSMEEINSSGSGDSE